MTLLFLKGVDCIKSVWKHAFSSLFYY